MELVQWVVLNVLLVEPYASQMIDCDGGAVVGFVVDMIWCPVINIQCKHLMNAIE